MASLLQRLEDNAPGDFYVDATCIDCDACRRIAPSVFAEAADHSYVARQPENETERLRSLMALVACPTGSIGTVSRQDVRPALEAFPEPVEENVFFCGFTSKDSFGAWSYFLERPEGNVLIDSPKAVPRLVHEFSRRGGIATMFLTHRDDVADHGAFRQRFGCERILHERDVTGGTAAVERKIAGEKPVPLAEDLLAIPTPGHTRGHMVLLYRAKFLFTGDHLAWSRSGKRLTAFRDACWYSWTEQARSMDRLLDFSFEWVLPGHGSAYRAESPTSMRRELERCIAWMKGANVSR
ncbi:MAG TPA: MBL fold metallo-hydrolase [Thermoanaerobaculia bacterium]|nr:MBL fold metallo-hydrolase [Thermoanaerobaculia bacterium]